MPLAAPLRRLLAALLAVAVALCVAAPAALADDGDDDGELLTAVAVVAVIAALAVGGKVRQHMARQRRLERERDVAMAAAVAIRDDPRFSVEAVRKRAAQLYVGLHDAWDRRDAVALERLLVPELFAAWRRRLDDLDRSGWHHRVVDVEATSVEYVGLVNLAGDSNDRVTVRICARLRDYHLDGGGRVFAREARRCASC